MNRMAAAVALAAIGIAAFAQEFPLPAAAQSDAKVAPGKWEIERVRCSDLLGADDEDRASAAMFYFGYLAAKTNLRVIDVNNLSDNIAKVMKQCSAKPSEPVPEAFREALGSRH
jgi:hypothetical protein